MSITDYKKEFIKCLKSIDYSRCDSEVFNDFCTFATLGLYNPFAKNADYEKEYLNTIHRYKNYNKFPELLWILIQELERNPWQDFLGEIYQEIQANNKQCGQFFTPFHVSDFMARCVYLDEEIKNLINKNGYFTLSEPACGAGGMIIAMAKAIDSVGLNPQTCMWFSATDIDYKCFNMTFIQTSLLGLSGEVIHGNTLSLEHWRRYITPMSRTGLWPIRFQKDELVEHLKNLVSGGVQPKIDGTPPNIEEQAGFQNLSLSDYNIVIDKKAQKAKEKGQLSLFTQ